tara:strand:+ start:622 stop:864 length:243 start_codon:yes stop_codon:yes gene_type:complete
MPQFTIILDGIDSSARVFTLTHKGDPMIDTDPDTGEEYLLTLAEAVDERECVRFAWSECGDTFIENDWQIVAIVPVKVTD